MSIPELVHEPNYLQYATISDPEREIPWMQCTSTPTCPGSSPSASLGVDDKLVSIQSQAPFKWQRMSSLISSSISMCFIPNSSLKGLIPFSSHKVHFGISSVRTTESTYRMLRDLSRETERAAKRLSLKLIHHFVDVRWNTYSDMYRPGTGLTWEMLVSLRDCITSKKAPDEIKIILERRINVVSPPWGLFLFM